MNAHDRQNLDFLIALSDNGLEQWFSQASADDVAYATELLAAWELSMIQQEQELGQTLYGVSFVSPSASVH